MTDTMRNHILLEISSLSFSKCNSFPMDIKICMLNLSLNEIQRKIVLLLELFSLS